MRRDWKTDFRSFYYEDAPIPDNPTFTASTTALLVIDLQNTYIKSPRSEHEAMRWSWFDKRIAETVVPNLQALLSTCRDANISVLYARIACVDEHGRDRSLSQKKPGFNNLMLPKDSWDSQIIDEIGPQPQEIVVLKTTDSALTGTNLRLMLSNMGITTVICTGIFTDQCVSSTVRSLADESFDVWLVEDCCAAATEALHDHELRVLNWIYCQVVQTEDMVEFIQSSTRGSTP
jgi:biuret amidohydrolase